jgi:hypothetical protein
MVRFVVFGLVALCAVCPVLAVIPEGVYRIIYIPPKVGPTEIPHYLTLGAATANATFHPQRRTGNLANTQLVRVCRAYHVCKAHSLSAVESD